MMAAVFYVDVVILPDGRHFGETRDVQGAFGWSASPGWLRRKMKHYIWLMLEMRNKRFGAPFPEAVSGPEDIIVDLIYPDPCNVPENVTTQPDQTLTRE